MAWRHQARRLMEETAYARDSNERQQLRARWSARDHGDQSVHNRAEEALRAGEQIATHIRSITRVLVDGSAEAWPMPGVRAILVATASATDAYATWMALGDSSVHPRRLVETMHEANDSLDSTLILLQEQSATCATQWLTFGAILTMNQWILAELEQGSRRHGQPAAHRRQVEPSRDWSGSVRDL